jgi:hypothetical protein
MAASTPSTDPNWAWDTSGWTNQGNTGDVEKSSGALLNSVYGTAGLSGVLAQTWDPILNTTNAALPATNTFYGTLVYLPTPVYTTKVVANQSTAGTTTHGYFAVLSATSATLGTTVCATADQVAATTTAAVSWATATVLSPGLYYFGYAFTWSVQTKFDGLPVLGVTDSQLVTSPANPRFVTGSVTITSAFPATVTLAAQTTLGAGYVGIL